MTLSKIPCLGARETESAKEDENLSLILRRCTVVDSIRGLDGLKSHRIRLVTLEVVHKTIRGTLQFRYQTIVEYSITSIRKLFESRETTSMTWEH